MVFFACYIGIHDSTVCNITINNFFACDMTILKLYPLLVFDFFFLVIHWLLLTNLDLRLFFFKHWLIIIQINCVCMHCNTLQTQLFRPGIYRKPLIPSGYTLLLLTFTKKELSLGDANRKPSLQYLSYNLRRHWSSDVEAVWRVMKCSGHCIHIVWRSLSL